MKRSRQVTSGDHHAAAEIPGDPDRGFDEGPGESRDPERDRLSARAAANGIYEALRRDILSGDLPGGSAISQLILSRRFGTSRGPVREALRRLQQEELITVEINKRARVASFSLFDFEQLNLLLLAVGTVAVRVTVPKLGEEELERLAQKLASMERARDLESFQAAQRGFLSLLVRGAGERVVGTLEHVTNHLERYQRSFFAGQSGWPLPVEGYRAVLQACAQRDPAAASVAYARQLARHALETLGAAAPEHRAHLIQGYLASLPMA